MCLCFFLISPADLPIKFLLSFNREESIYRPTTPLSSFEEDPNILGGRDRREKGTWLAINKKTLNIAFLTNYRTSQSQMMFLKGLKFRRSRGELINNFVKSSFFTSDPNVDEIIAFIQKIKENCNDYGPFNLVVGNLGLNAFFYFGNQSVIKDFLIVEEGVHSVCNSEMFGLAENDRQKRGTQKLNEIIKEIKKYEKNFDKERLADKILYDVMMRKGVFQNIQYLTTKSTSIIICDRDNQILFKEATYNYNLPVLTKYLGIGGYQIELKSILVTDNLQKNNGEDN